MSSEAISRFRCFGSSCAVLASGPGAAEGVTRARRRMLAWHDQFTRFDQDSELSRLNRDPSETVSVSPVLLRVIAAGVEGARLTGGLVDPTLLPELRTAGYRCSLGTVGGPGTVALSAALQCAPSRRAATPHGDARWRDVSVDSRAGTVTRPLGLELDLSGIAKGVFGDITADALHRHDSFAVDAGGDVRFGGRHTRERAVEITAPEADDYVLHTFLLQQGAVATSGIGRRVWSDPDGRPAHHLLDPGRGTSAFTGLVQVTALAATGVEAEIRAKAALLAGPTRATEWLPDGGLTVAEDGSVTVVEPSSGLLAPGVPAT